MLLLLFCLFLLLLFFCLVGWFGGGVCGIIFISSNSDHVLEALHTKKFPWFAAAAAAIENYLSLSHLMWK